VRIALVLVSVTAIACSRSYDWSPFEQALAHSLPVGSTVSRVNAVLDSLGFDHTQFDPMDSTIHARKQEPRERMVFSTLQVFFKFDGNGRLLKDSTHLVFTGP
jgi:hypothetical protein